MKKMNQRRYRGDKLNTLRSIKLFAALAAAFAVLFGLVIGISLVSGNSMYPTAKTGHPAVYFRMERSYSRGEIVVVRMPSGERLIKRVIAVEGDELDIRDGKVYVNGITESGSYVNGSTTLPEEANGTQSDYPMTIGAGMIYVLGDNREVSVDSRSIGPVAESQIRGKVFWMP